VSLAFNIRLLRHGQPLVMWIAALKTFTYNREQTMPYRVLKTRQYGCYVKSTIGELGQSSGQMHSSKEEGSFPPAALNYKLPNKRDRLRWG